MRNTTAPAPRRALLAFALLFTLSFAACDSVEAPTAPDAPRLGLDAGSAPAGALEDGRLVFDDHKAFQAAYEVLAGADAFDGSADKRGFTSMRSQAEADADAVNVGAMKAEDASVSVIVDPVLASLVSPSGLVQIGDDVLKVGSTHVFKGTKEDAAAMGAANEADLLADQKDAIDAAPIVDGDESAASASSAAGSFVDGTARQCARFGSIYRVCGVTWIKRFPWIIRTAGSATSVVSFVYSPMRADVLGLSGTRQLARHGRVLPAPTTFNHTATNAYVLARIFYTTVGFPPPGIYGTINATHTGTKYGVTGTVTTALTTGQGTP